MQESWPGHAHFVVRVPKNRRRSCADFARPGNSTASRTTCDVAGVSLVLGWMPCAGCGGVMPEHVGGLCAACDLGVDRADFPTRLMRYALILRVAHGPAGSRGVRLDRIRELAECDAQQLEQQLQDLKQALALLREQSIR